MHTNCRSDAAVPSPAVPRPPFSSAFGAARSAGTPLFNSPPSSRAAHPAAAAAVPAPSAAATCASPASRPSPRSSRPCAAGHSVTELHDCDGGVTRRRGDVIILQLQQLREGEDEHDGGSENTQRWLGKSAAGARRASVNGRRRENDVADLEAGSEVANAESAHNSESSASSSTMVPAARSTTAITSTTGAVQCLDAEGELQRAELLLSSDAAFLAEPDAIDRQHVPDVAMSDMWQACGYRHFSDLMPNNLIRAFTPSMAGSQSAYERLLDVQRAKEARLAKYGAGQPPVVTVAAVEATVEERHRRFETSMDSRTHTPRTPACTSSVLRSQPQPMLRKWC